MGLKVEVLDYDGSSNDDYVDLLAADVPTTIGSHDNLVLRGRTWSVLCTYTFYTHKW